MDKIYILLGQKVMLNFELAEIYKYETKRFNEQVKNNIENLMMILDFNLQKGERVSSKDTGERITIISEVVEQMFYIYLVNKLLKNSILKLK